MSTVDLRPLDLQRICQCLESLPNLVAADVPQDEFCPICLTSFTAILAEQKDELACPSASRAKLLGVTKLAGCGHMFCRTDISEWIKNAHGSCPTCRHVFLDIKPYSDSDNESSDGGEYIPGEDDDDDTDDVFDMDILPSSDVDELEVRDIDWTTINDGTNAALTNMDAALIDIDTALMDLDALKGDEDVSEVQETDGYMSEAGSSFDGLTDGYDTLSFEREESSINVEDDDLDAYAGDISMASGDEEDDDEDILVPEHDSQVESL